MCRRGISCPQRIFIPGSNGCGLFFSTLKGLSVCASQRTALASSPHFDSSTHQLHILGVKKIRSFHQLLMASRCNFYSNINSHDSKGTLECGKRSWQLIKSKLKQFKRCIKEVGNNTKEK